MCTPAPRMCAPARCAARWQRRAARWQTSLQPSTSQVQACMPFCGLAPRRCKLAHPSASLHDRAAGLHVTPLACTSDVHVYEKTRWLFDQFESPKIVFGPVGCVEHAGKRLDDEGIRCVMVGDGDGAVVLVFVAAVASFSAGEIESISFERFDEFAGGDSARDQTVTSTAGDSTSRIAALGGIGFPSSRISSRMSLIASWIRSRACSLVSPHV